MKRKKRGFFKKLGKFFLWVAGLGAVGAAVCLAVFIALWGKFDPEKLENAAQSTKVFDAQGELAALTYHEENRQKIEIETLPEYTKNAFLAAEDLRFYRHLGIDPIRIAGAIIEDIKTMSFAQGASTITQQLVKLTHLTNEKSIARKLQEAYYAVQVELAYEKDEILEMYVNRVYFGAGAYGIEQAAQTYFSKPAKELTLSQSACLAAILKAPSHYAPHLDYEKNRQRAENILQTMLENDMILPEEYAAAMADPPVLQRSEQQPAGNWLTDAALDEAAGLLGLDAQALSTGGYHIYTTLDADLQTACEAAAAQEDVVPEGAQTAMALVEKGGAVRALVGGMEYTTGALNRAAYSRRQPGSALKPISVYVNAFSRLGRTTTDTLLDAPQEFDGYAPKNFGDAYYGVVTLRTAFEKSLNNPAVGLLYQLGPQSAHDALASFGLSPEAEDKYLSLALGSMAYGVTPLSLAGAYSVFITEGMLYAPYFVEKIVSPEGEILYEHAPASTRVIDMGTASLVLSLLRSTVQNGTGRGLSHLPFDVGAKTGTVGYGEFGNSDAWCAAVTSEYSLVVWMGHDVTSPESCLPAQVTGSQNPTHCAALVLAQMEKPGQDFTYPGTDAVQIDAYTLQTQGRASLATQYTPKEYVLLERYLPGTQPTQASEFWQKPDIPQVTLSTGTDRSPLLTITAQGEHISYEIYRESSGQTQLLATLSGAQAGTQLSYFDQNTQLFASYGYTVRAIHTMAVGDCTAQSETLTHRSSLFPFTFPWGDW